MYIFLRKQPDQVDVSALTVLSDYSDLSVEPDRCQAMIILEHVLPGKLHSFPDLESREEGMEGRERSVGRALHHDDVVFLEAHVRRVHSEQLPVDLSEVRTLRLSFVIPRGYESLDRVEFLIGHVRHQMMHVRPESLVQFRHG